MAKNYFQKIDDWKPSTKTEKTCARCKKGIGENHLQLISKHRVKNDEHYFCNEECLRSFLES